MRLSPLDIRKQTFDTSLRGYSKEDVDAFLQMVSEQWEEVRDEQRRMEDQVRTLKNKMQHYEQVEEALQEALQTARENSEQKLENADQKATLIVQEAEAHADTIKREAREDREVLRRQVDQLQKRRDEGVAHLRGFLMSEMELLLRFDGEDTETLREALPEPLAQHLGGGKAETQERKTEAAASSRSGSAPPDGPPSEKAGTEDAGAQTAEAQAAEAAQAPPASAFNVPVSEDFSDETAPSQSGEEDRRGPQRTEVVAPQETPAGRGERRDEATRDENAPEELADFLEQFEAEQALDEPPSDDQPSDDQPSDDQSFEERTVEERNPGASSAEASAEKSASQESPSASPSDRVEVNTIFASAQEEREAAPGAAGDDMTATSDEIEKIRRILNDME